MYQLAEVSVSTVQWFCSCAHYTGNTSFATFSGTGVNMQFAAGNQLPIMSWNN